MAAVKSRWPLGRGFERFYGFLGGESSSWYPPDLVYDNHPIDAPRNPPGRRLPSVERLADKAIEFIRDARVVDPDKPFFMYLAPQAGHAPHHVFTEWADRYKAGSTRATRQSVPRSCSGRRISGCYPRTPSSPPINPHGGEPATTGPDGQPWPLLDTVRPWGGSLTADEQRLFIRMAEVFAGYISYTDDQLGRVIDLLEATGELDNTLIVVVSDNGASGEGGGRTDRSTNGGSSTGSPDTAEGTLPHLDELGTPASYNHYNTGWAWAFDTPFPYWKRWAGYEGGIADMCVLSWPARIDASAEPRQQYVHAVDVVPTIYELLGITPPPEVLKGYTQSPLEGESFAASLTDPAAPGKDVQFYTMLGQRSLYHDGWLVCSVHPPLSGWGGHFDKDVWELYHLTEDRARLHDLADAEPERLEALKSLWFYYAGRYHGLPLDDRSALEQVLAERPPPGKDAGPLRLLPGLRGRPPRGGRCRHHRTVLHDRRGSPPGFGGCRGESSTPTAAWPAVTVSTSRIVVCATPSTGSARTCRPWSPTGTSVPETRVHRRIRPLREEHRSGDAGVRRHPDPLRRRSAGGDR